MSKRHLSSVPYSLYHSVCKLTPACLQVSKLERVLNEERAGRERQVSELEAYATQLELELEAEQKRRLSDQLRALVEGAPFLLYKSSEVQERHVWFR